MVKTKKTPRKSDVRGRLPPFAPWHATTEWGTAAEMFHKRLVLPLDPRRSARSGRNYQILYREKLECSSFFLHVYFPSPFVVDGYFFDPWHGFPLKITQIKEDSLGVLQRMRDCCSSRLRKCETTRVDPTFWSERNETMMNNSSWHWRNHSVLQALIDTNNTYLITVILWKYITGIRFYKMQKEQLGWGRKRVIKLHKIIIQFSFNSRNLEMLVSLSLRWCLFCTT